MKKFQGIHGDPLISFVDIEGEEGQECHRAHLVAGLPIPSTLSFLQAKGICMWTNSASAIVMLMDYFTYF